MQPREADSQMPQARNPNSSVTDSRDVTIAEFTGILGTSLFRSIARNTAAFFHITVCQTQRSLARFIHPRPTSSLSHAPEKQIFHDSKNFEYRTSHQLWDLSALARRHA
jgi:hypothetical protein